MIPQHAHLLELLGIDPTVVLLVMKCKRLEIFVLLVLVEAFLSPPS